MNDLLIIHDQNCMNVNADFYSSLTFPNIVIEICIYNPKMGNHVEKYAVHANYSKFSN